MSIKNERDYLYVIWKDPNSRRQYTIGELSKNGKYEFCYCHEIDEAIESGFEALISFDDIKKKYVSNRLFPPFASRLPDKKRKDINEILSKYNMTEYNEYTLLKRSGGILPIDTLKFIDPILETPREGIKISFCIAGVRHYSNCNGKDCSKLNDIKENDNLILELEPSNQHDKYAIKILNTSNILIGYVPRYYNKELTNLINNNFTYKCTIIKINKDTKCDVCIQVILKMARKEAYV